MFEVGIDVVIWRCTIFLQKAVPESGDDKDKQFVSSKSVFDKKNVIMQECILVCRETKFIHTGRPI